MSYEYKTEEEIRQDILKSVSDDYEKSPGNLTYDIPSAVALSLSSMYENLELLVSRQDVDNLSADDLARFVRQRKGILKKPSTKSKGTLNIVGNGIIYVGDIFETDSGTAFISIETVEIIASGNVKVEAFNSGVSGNVGANTIRFMPVTLSGIVSVNNLLPTMDGFNEESDESLRDRYYEALQRPATSGNIYHYLAWSKEISGVGDARVVPLWNGANTVKVILINDLKLPASSDIVNQVQENIDPKGEFVNDAWTSWGTGSGKAPIGAYCTVESAETLGLIIQSSLDIDNNTNLEVVKTKLESNIIDYLRSVAFNQDYVSYAKIGSIILATEGVRDYTSLTINGGQININIASHQVATLDSLIIV